MIIKSEIEQDKGFMDLCNFISKKSNCLSRNVGTVLVKDKSIISTGYNGPARGIPHCGERHKYDINLLKEYKKIDENFDSSITVTRCPRQILGFKSGEGLEFCVAGHGERNAIVNSAREGISTEGATLYMNCGIPCKDCLTEIINSGISEIVVDKFMFYDISSKYLLESSKLKYRLFSHLIDFRDDGPY